MYLSTSALVVLFSATTNNNVATAFVPSCLSSNTARRKTSMTPLKGYLDDLSKELYSQEDTPDIEKTREATNMDKSLIDRAGPGSFADYVDFNEFDGGDGQMGVAGDGNAGLEKIDAVPELANSKSMSAKNAWGTDTGYANQLREKGVETARAQQLENWANQREVRAKTRQMQEMAEAFDAIEQTAEEDWRTLAKFGVERNEEFDMDEEFGPVTAGDDIEEVIELKTALGKVVTYDIHLKNPYMGFADFRAAFTADTPMDWSVEPNEGSLQQREATHFIVKFKPQGPGLIQGHLVIETEDFKKTWMVQGST